MGLKKIQHETTLIVGELICTLRQADEAILELMVGYGKIIQKPRNRIFFVNSTVLPEWSLRSVN